ncbi:uncharacterized protein PV06_11478 [Exophiala oligosperma]|uniref:ferric-chelate reductase (NADPH) n=1 Tax=Exophiala oligosperma TaxID=215243 RepID=A0A0D2D1X8_9EURO|nr:uncharacterized protein PV06_11478 [Exophiala oligosperma]KIW36230.1 hypothetical protein PV06_11478 [Exophiala oligosperma]
MEITQIYAVVIAGIALIFLLQTGVSSFAPRLIATASRTHQYLSYTYVLNRHAFMGPWTVTAVLLRVIYLAVNVVCLGVGVADLSHTGRRAGTLSVINLGPLLSGLHLNFLADLLGLSVGAIRAAHRTVSFVAFGLAAFHVIVAAVTERALFRRELEKPFVVIAALAFCILIITPRRLVQKASYEIFIRLHQILSLLCAASIWQHLSSVRCPDRLYLLIFLALMAVAFACEAVLVLVRNGWSFLKRSRVTVTNSCGMLKVKVHLCKPLKIEPGQYINLWMPSVGLGAFWQSHPFMVASWSTEAQEYLEIFIQPRRGLTRDLHHIARPDGPFVCKWAMFSGPHGNTVAVGEYETVVLIADGVGIASQVPYLKKLIHGYHNRRVITRRIHLIWQISDIDVGIAAQPFVNDVLDEDKLESGGILQVSIYVNLDDISKISFGRRSTVYPGKANFDELVEKELAFNAESRETAKWKAFLVVFPQPRSPPSIERNVSGPHPSSRFKLTEFRRTKSGATKCPVRVLDR